MAIENKITDLNLARKIIEAYAEDIDGFKLAECKDLDDSLSWTQCVSLTDVLQNGENGIITNAERKYLRNRNFSKDFINEIAGDNGAKALKKRAGWLIDNSVKKSIRWDASDDERSQMGAELVFIGIHAFEPLISAIGKANDSNNRKTYYKMAKNIAIKIQPEWYSAYTSGEWCLNTDGWGCERLHSCANDLTANTHKNYPQLDLNNDLLTPFYTFVFGKCENNGAKYFALDKLSHMDDFRDAVIPTLINGLEHFRDGNYHRGFSHLYHYLLGIPKINIGWRNEDASVREKALYIINHIPDLPDHLLPYLIEALKDPSERVRESAIEALSNFGAMAKPALPQLLSMLKNPKSSSIALRNTIGILREIGPDSKIAVPLLINLLDFKPPLFIKGRFTDSHRFYEVITETIKTLGMLGPYAKSAIPPLMNIIEDRNPRINTIIENKNRHFKGRDRLNRIEDNWSSLRMLAINALGETRTNNANAIELLINILSSANEPFTMRHPSLESLSFIGKPAVPYLINLFECDEITQKLAIIALSEMGSEAHDALPFLELVTINNQLKSIRQQANKAIKTIENNTK